MVVGNHWRSVTESVQVLNNRVGLRDLAVAIDQSRKLSGRGQLSHASRILGMIGINHAELKRYIPFVCGDESLPSKGGEGMTINFDCHIKSLS
ncbi:hypothetical protein D9M68_986050 [compost metagenome]